MRRTRQLSIWARQSSSTQRNNGSYWRAMNGVETHLCFLEVCTQAQLVNGPRASLQRAPTTQQHACTHFGSCSDTWLADPQRTYCAGSAAGQASSPVPVRQFRRRRRDVKSPSAARPPNTSACGPTCTPPSTVPAAKPANQRVQHQHRSPG